MVLLKLLFPGCWDFERDPYCNMNHCVGTRFSSQLSLRAIPKYLRIAARTSPSSRVQLVLRQRDSTTKSPCKVMHASYVTCPYMQTSDSQVQVGMSDAGHTMRHVSAIVCVPAVQPELQGL